MRVMLGFAWPSCFETKVIAAPACIAYKAQRLLADQLARLDDSAPRIWDSTAVLSRYRRLPEWSRTRGSSSGQSGIAAKRFIVVEAVADQFVDGFMRELHHGECATPRRATRRSARRRASSCATRAIDRSRRKGAFYPATVLTAVDRGMPAFDEETFGPVAAVIRAKDETDAVRLANDSPFGRRVDLHASRACRAPDRAG